ncbi:MAG TPA: phospholipid carrier-dependent glycosyltransferase, partial [Moraxellaceae bacterium]
MKSRQWVMVWGMVLVVILGVLFRMGYQAQAVIPKPIKADAAQYLHIGWNMLHHGVVSMAAPSTATPPPDSYRGPGYPALVMLALQFGGEASGEWYGRLLSIQALLGGLTALLTVVLARYWLPTGYALAAGVLVALWPHMVTLSGYVLTETLFAFLLVLGLCLFCRGQRAASLPWIAAAGLVFGAAALVNPMIVLFPLLLAAWLAFAQPRQAVVLLLLAALLPGAWAIRSAQVEAKTIVTANGRLMENILIGMEPDFDSVYLGARAGHVARARVQEQLAIYRQDKAQAWENVAQRLAQAPVFYAKWYFVAKPMLFWSWYIGQGAGDLYVYPVQHSPFEANLLYRTVAAVAGGLNPLLMLAAFAMVAVLLVRRLQGRQDAGFAPLVVVALLFFYTTALHSLLAPDVRYATPFRPFEILLAVSLCWFLHAAVRQARRATASQPATPAG